MSLTVGLPATFNYHVACDRAGCGAAYQRDAGSVDEILWRLTGAGWTIRAGFYCPTHSGDKR